MPSLLERILPAKPDPAVAERREYLRTERGRKDELAAELKELRAERAALQERIDRGELTGRAIESITQRIDHLRNRLFAIGNTHRIELLDTAPPSLRSEYLSLIERKKSALAFRERCKRDLSEAEEHHRAAEKQYADVLKRQETDRREVWSERDHRSMQSRIEGLRREVETARDELADSDKKLARILEKLEDCKARMLEA